MFKWMFESINYVLGADDKQPEPEEITSVLDSEVDSIVVGMKVLDEEPKIISNRRASLRESRLTKPGPISHRHLFKAAGASYEEYKKMKEQQTRSNRLRTHEHKWSTRLRPRCYVGRRMKRRSRRH